MARRQYPRHGRGCRSLLLALAVLAAPTVLVAGMSPAPAAAARTPHHGQARPHHQRKHTRHRGTARFRPRAFASCASLVGYAQAHFSVTHGLADPIVRPFTPGPVAFAGPQTGASGAPSAPAPQASAGGGAGSTFSTTNNQEIGVDEPDTVKTDGTTIFTLSQGTLYAVAGKDAPRLLGSLALGNTGYGAQMLLRGGRLIVISGGSPGPLGVGLGVARPAASTSASGPSIAPRPSVSSIYSSPYYYPANTTITEVDVHDPAAMHVTRTMGVDGTFVDGRQNGGSVRLVIASAPRAIEQATLRSNSRGWVPTRSFRSLITGRHYVQAVAPCAAISRPVQFSGLGMLTILTINLDRGLYASDSRALMADAQVVYGSQNSLYIATQKWVAPSLSPDQVPASLSTVIDKFDVTDPDHTTLVASGEVPGYVLNQFSMSEDRGYLRVATTSRPIWWGPQPPQSLSQSFVTVLADQGGVLAPVGQVSGLGAGQQIYSVRFVGDAGYVVTFRRVDPLYTLDLHSPTAPRVAGQLELEGYSSYLHPLGDGLLLGVGQDVGSGNEPSGSQLELFDVSNPSSPRLVQKTGLGGGSSTQVQYDHHAFLYWAPSHLAVLPVQIYSYPASKAGPPTSEPGTTQSFAGAIGFRVDRSGITEVGRISQDPVNGYPPAITRSLVIDQRLFSISDVGVLSSSLDTLARQAFVTLPAPPSPGGTGGSGGGGPQPAR